MKTYDDVYRESGYYWGKEPNDLCKRTLDFFPAESRDGKTLIDLGCGEGRDVVRFARNGISVTGVDASAEGLKKAEGWLKEEGLTAELVKGDINTFSFDMKYDFIYSSGSLTFSAPGKRDSLFSKFRENTSDGGVNAFNVFVEKPFLQDAPDWGEDESYFRSGDLMAAYWDWEILYAGEETFDCSSSGKPHRHAMDTIIARKPL